MALALPIAIPVGMLGLSRQGGRLLAVSVASTLEIFLMYSLVFVVFYTLVSMATTRRDEGVLKRLRTGEASDREIVFAMCVPALALVATLSLLVVTLVLLLGGPPPVFLPPILVAFVGGTVVFVALAFATSACTKNAEATQITSLPVVTLAAVGMTNIRGILPEGPISTVVSVTPMAAVADLIHWGWAGAPASLGVNAATTDAVEIIGHSIQPTVILLAWSLVTVLLARTYFRWDART